MEDIKIDYRIQNNKYGQVTITRVLIPDEIKNKSVTVGNTEIEFFEDIKKAKEIILSEKGPGNFQANL